MSRSLRIRDRSWELAVHIHMGKSGQTEIFHCLKWTTASTQLFYKAIIPTSSWLSSHWNSKEWAFDTGEWIVCCSRAILQHGPTRPWYFRKNTSNLSVRWKTRIWRIWLYSQTTDITIWQDIFYFLSVFHGNPPTDWCCGSFWVAVPYAFLPSFTSKQYYKEILCGLWDACRTTAWYHTRVSSTDTKGDSWLTHYFHHL